MILICTYFLQTDCVSCAGAEGCRKAKRLQNCQIAAGTIMKSSSCMKYFSCLKKTLLMKWNGMNEWMSGWKAVRWMDEMKTNEVKWKMDEMVMMMKWNETKERDFFSFRKHEVSGDPDFHLKFSVWDCQSEIGFQAHTFILFFFSKLKLKETEIRLMEEKNSSPPASFQNRFGTT